MEQWDTYQFPDEKMPRSHIVYKGVQCLCFPSEKNNKKFDISVFTSEGGWRGGPYRLVEIRETYEEENFKGISTLEESQKICLETVERYLKGETDPIYTERRFDPAKSNNSGASVKRSTKRKKSKK